MPMNNIKKLGLERVKSTRTQMITSINFTKILLGGGGDFRESGVFEY